MVSKGVRKQVTLQVQLVASANRSKTSIQIGLDQTVEELKVVMGDRTGIPPDQQCLVYKGRDLKNSQTIRSCELKPDQTIHLLRCGLPSGESVFSVAKVRTPENGVSDKTKPEFLDNGLDVKGIIKSIPVLHLEEESVVAKMLQNSVILRCVLSFLFYLEINRSKSSDKADITKKTKLLTEGYKYKCNGGQKARGICLSEMKQACDANELREPPLNHNAHRGAIDTFAQILLSDAIFLRHYKEQGKSIDRAITALLGWDDASRYQSSPGVGNLGALHNGDCSLDFSLYQKLRHALPNNEDYNSSCSPNGGSDDIGTEERSREMVSLQLAEMKEMGFLNERENLRALLHSGGCVEKAVEKLLEKKIQHEGQ